MSKMIDPAKVEAAIAGMSQHLSQFTDKPGQQGTTARAMLAILPATARWGATEFSRDTPVEEGLTALAVVMSNALASELDNMDCEIDTKVQNLNWFLRVVMAGTFEIINKPADVKRAAFIQSEECGNA